MKKIDIHHKYMQLKKWWVLHSSTVLIIIIALFSGGSMVLLAYQGHKISQQATASKTYNQQQLDAIKKVVDQIQLSGQNRSEQIKTLTEHIDCIATFFAQTDRSQIVLKNLDECILTNAQTGSQTAADPPTTKSNNSSPKPASQPAKSNPPANTGDDQTPPPADAPKNCTIDLLGLHLLCP